MRIRRKGQSVVEEFAKMEQLDVHGCSLHAIENKKLTGWSQDRHLSLHRQSQPYAPGKQPEIERKRQYQYERNPISPSPSIKKAILGELNPQALSLTHPNKLREFISSLHGLRTDQSLWVMAPMTFLICAPVVFRRQFVGMLEPSYSLYEVIALQDSTLIRILLTILFFGSAGGDRFRGEPFFQTSPCSRGREYRLIALDKSSKNSKVSG